MNEQGLLARLHASPTGVALLGGIGGVLPTQTTDPTATTPQDGSAIAWSDGANTYLSIYYAAIPAWRTVALT